MDENVNFIFAGSKQHVMQEMFMSSKKPFYQSTQLLTIDTIDKDKYTQFAMNHFAKHHTNLPEGVFCGIYNFKNKKIRDSIESRISHLHKMFYSALVNCFLAGLLKSKSVPPKEQRQLCD